MLLVGFTDFRMGFPVVFVVGLLIVVLAGFTNGFSSGGGFLLFVVQSPKHV